MVLSSHGPPLPESWARGISYPWRRRENAPMVSFDATNDLARSRAKVAASEPLHDQRGRMTFARRSFLQLAGALTAAAVFPKLASAIDYPTRPIRLVIGFPPGGGADVVGRIMARWLSERLGQQVIVENKPGAGMNIATQTVISSAPDGYTLLWVGTSNVVNATLYQNLPFNFLRDIAPVAGLVIYPIVMEANPSLPVKSLPEFIAFAKANPGKISMASFGIGTSSHLAGELFKAMTAVNLIHVPYRGGAPMVNDLLGGQVEVAFDVVANSLPHIRSGALRALAVTTTTRLEALPDVPAIAETVPGYEALAWTGIGVPSGTPSWIVEKLNREINEGLTHPSIKARLAELTITPMIFTPADFGIYMASETEKWGKVIREANIKAE
jgi:tripartite-type tricarboxylate transporter receptor subunit TctC